VGAQRILILCVGNLLMGDDGIGVIIGRELLRRGLNVDVKVFDGGVDAVRLLDEVAGYDELILVDSVDGRLPPGELIVVEADAEDLAKGVGDKSMISLHELDVFTALRLGYMVFPEKMPRKMIVVGVGVKEVRQGIGLSREVEEALPRAIELLKKIINKHG